jgi:serine/threonine-protein kinase
MEGPNTVSNAGQNTTGSQSAGGGSGSLSAPAFSSIGRYEVIYPIARGGMASVHVGRLPGMAGFEKLVAVKVIHPHLCGEREFIEMFLDEARLAARIHHPNVVEIYEVGEDNGQYFMVGELIEGQHLRVVMRRATTRGVEVSPALSAYVAAEVARGLHTAHELTDQNGRPLNLVHRDVSLNNVLVSYSGFVKLIDFGVAWAEGRLAHTKTGTLKGKIGFMSPEQILGEQLDRRSDIFALGVVLYKLITGAHPFPGESDAERINKILEVNPVPPSEVNPRVSPELERIVLTALAKPREQRHHDAAVLADELQAYVSSTGEEVGTDALSRMMRKLFEEEITDHHEQLRAYREERPDEPYDAARAEGPDEDVTSAARPSAKQRRGKPGSHRRLLLAVGAILGIAALGVTAVLLTTPGSDPAAPARPTPVQPQESDAENAPSEPTPPAAASGEHPVAEPAVPATVSVTLDISPVGSRIALDGERLPAGTDQLELRADGSPHTVEISAAGYHTERKTVVADSDQALSLRLKPKRSKPKQGNAKTGKMDSDINLIHSPYRGDNR